MTDVYLQPHSNAVCFSLAGTARRAPGVLVTVFPVSNRVAGPHRPSIEKVTALRTAEDRCFATEVGMTAHFLDLPDAASLGWQPFDLTRRAQNVRRVQAPLMTELFRIAADQPERPWLFCPAGIGGHVDHVAVRDAVTSQRACLSRHFRLAFYEDLHYAAQLSLRTTGLARLFARLGEPDLRRWVHRLDADAAADKCASISHYRSQLRRAPSDLAEYVPATVPASPPHEAVWTTEGPPKGFIAAAGSADAITAVARSLARLTR